MREARRSSIAGAITPRTMDRMVALSRTERTTAVTHLHASVEHLANDRERRVGGVNEWAVIREESRFTSKRFRALLDLVSRPGATNAIHIGKILAAGVLLAPRRPAYVACAANAYLAGASFLLGPRHHYGADGSDHVSFMVQTTCAVARALSHRPRVVDAALWSVALQLTVSYAVSGWVKLAGDMWRQDRAVVGVMRTRTYGQRHIWKLLTDHPALNTVIGRSTLALECGFPLVYVAGGRLARPALLGMTGLHLGIAGSMGLGRFVTAFLAMQPAVLYTAVRDPRPVSEGGRSDLVPTITGILGIGAFGFLGVRAAIRRRAVVTPAADERILETSTGSRLRYLVSGRTDPNAPVIVFENGLLSTAHFWHWIAEGLSDQATVVTYHRAGYASSLTGRRGRPIADLDRDLQELCGHVGSGRRVVVVGHSLGGYLAHRLAARRPDLVSAVVVVDSTHPLELERSAQQRVGNEALVPNLRLSAVSIGLGLGDLLDPAAWHAQLPTSVAEQADLHYPG